MKAANPLAFRPWPVTIFCTAFYLAFCIVLLYVGLRVPPAPGGDAPIAGLNMSEAYLDLEALTKAFHPYNSRSNMEVRKWLLSRIAAILESNGIDSATVHESASESGSPANEDAGSADAVVFDDMLVNTSLTSPSGALGRPAMSVYFESTNILVYCRGEEDSAGAWWEDTPYEGPKGVLVNAHYDSVSTGYGATDDGVGVVTILQLIRYFSMRENRPKHGILFLLNNGEEDFLNGARAFAQHRTSSFPDRFLNLEGAGAGGRAALFRSTDAAVTNFYGRARHPFATSASADGFKAGLVKSETDYRIFYGDMGLRGLDVAFLEPRSKYHTTDDDARHTGKDSIWHMLSAALPTTQGMASTELSDDRADAAWFDLFGEVFAVMKLHTLFALQVTLLVVAPISTIVFLILLQRQDKLYLFTRYRQVGEAKVALGGLRGWLRAPIIFVVSTGIAVGMAFLIIKINPFIVSSNPWTVWACFMSIWVFTTWFMSRIADVARPSALHRAHALLWLHVGAWTLAVAATVFEDKGISAGYLILFYELGFWLASLLSILELFALPKKATFAASEMGVSHAPRRTANASASEEAAYSHPHEDGQQESEEPTEQTALLGEQTTTFGTGYRRGNNATAPPDDSDEQHLHKDAYEHEQLWSGKLLSTLWIFEFILAAAPALMFIGPIAPFVTLGLTQTLSDGSGFGVYIVIATLSVLLLSPLQPFMHRFTYHVPLILLVVFAGTLSFNLATFPFSENVKLKIYFLQQVDLDAGVTTTVLTAADKSLLVMAADTIPSAGGSHNISDSSRSLMYDAMWSGIPPTAVPGQSFSDWVSINATRANSSSSPTNEGTISLLGQNTRNCKLLFDRPVKSFAVDDNGVSNGVPSAGVMELRLWRREWGTPWSVRLTWEGSNGGRGGATLEGRAVCNWNEDEAQAFGGIPGLKEVRQYAPTWAVFTKAADGLVEGSKKFKM